MLGEVCGVAPLLALEGVRVVRVRRGARLRRDARGAEEDEAREAHVVDDAHGRGGHHEAGATVSRHGQSDSKSAMPESGSSPLLHAHSSTTPQAMLVGSPSTASAHKLQSRVSIDLTGDEAAAAPVALPSATDDEPAGSAAEWVGAKDQS